MSGVCPAIVGPTAVGKTGLVTALAARHPIEVISLDSRQIYRGLRIGTAQPTAEELGVCPHHLIDFVSPAQKYDAVRYRRDFERVHEEIVARGARPLVVGGAGMYLTALREGFMAIPGTSPARLSEVRAELDRLEDRVIRERLRKEDPASFRNIHPNDRYRSQRALEIFLVSGETMSALKERQRPDPALGLTFPTFVLDRPVAELDRRIAGRTRDMLAAGWLEETRAALEIHPATCPGLMSIGYRQIVGFLAGNTDSEGMEKEIVLATRQYAKRQRTWFRHIPADFRGSPESPELMDALDACLAGG
jgi:tRNA dimethylallyltransferase